MVYILSDLHENANPSLPPLTGKPFLVINVVWHPKSSDGRRLAADLYSFYRRDYLSSVGAGAGIPVVYLIPGTESVPSFPSMDTSEETATILLIDEHWTSDGDWINWARELEKTTKSSGLKSRIFPVAVTEDALRIELMTEAILWCNWVDIAFDERLRRLTTDLSHQFCKMLRYWLAERSSPDTPGIRRKQYREPVKLFLSHTKRDEDGERIAMAIREYIFRVKGLTSFFDVYDISSGLEFDTEILENIRDCAVIAIYTDKYSSREWCRREVLEAKKHHVPLVVANSLQQSDERSFPYLGNVPVVRMDPRMVDRIDVTIGTLLTEVLRTFLWRCWSATVEKYKARNEVFVPRMPELVMLSEVGYGTEIVLVYPEPVIAAEEAALFGAVHPGVQLLSMLQWVARRSA